MKKGMTYVDLAISLGIFVIYSVFLFTILRPAIQEEFDEDYLTSIVQQGMLNDTFWTITKLPVFIDLTNQAAEGEAKLINVSLSFNWTTNNIILLNSTNSVLDSKIIDEEDMLQFASALDYSDMNSFTLLYSPDLINSNDNPTGNLLGDGNYTYQIGVPEFASGLSEAKFNNLSSYEELKEQWSYPTEREFEIVIFNATDNDELYSLHKVETLERIVYVLQWSTNLLLDNSEVNPILVRIRAW